MSGRVVVGVSWMLMSVVACSFDPGAAPPISVDPTDGGVGSQSDGAPRTSDAAPSPDAAPPAVPMMQVPAGPFTQGCLPLAFDCRYDEGPARTIELSAFEIDRTEVTRSEYADCVLAGACQPPTCHWNPETQPDHPVVCVSWVQANGFCEFRGKSLPTEAQWEKAARGSDSRLFPWGDEPANCERANYLPCGEGAPIAVGHRIPGSSPHGAQDMAGNVWEWVGDWYDDDYYATGPGADPLGPENGLDRVARGGSYEFSARFMLTSRRSQNDPGASFPDLGFRCAR